MSLKRQLSYSSLESECTEDDFVRDFVEWALGRDIEDSEFELLKSVVFKNYVIAVVEEFLESDQNAIL